MSSVRIVNVQNSLEYIDSNIMKVLSFSFYKNGKCGMNSKLTIHVTIRVVELNALMLVMLALAVGAEKNWKIEKKKCIVKFMARVTKFLHIA